MIEPEASICSSAGMFILGFVVLSGISVVEPDASTPPLRAQSAPQYRQLRTNDKGLRNLVTHAPTPNYPATSLRNKTTGVAVAAVATDVNGRVQSVDILESPDDAIGKAVSEAVRQWTFKSVGPPITSPTPVIGNLVFYFHIKEGKGMVSSPEEMQALKGVLPKDKQAQGEPSVKQIDEAEFARLKATDKPVVLDVRPRAAYQEGHRDGAVNVPLGEILTRAAAELPLSTHIVIDCFAQDYQANVCGVVAHQLTSAGFSQVSMLRR